MKINEIISQSGISLISYTVSNELKAEEFINSLKFERNNNITFEEILNSIKTKKNAKIHITQPLTNLSPLQQLIKQKHNLTTVFIRKLSYISISNNLSIILKSYRYNTFGTTVISGGNSPIYASSFVGIIENNKLIVEKSRYSNIIEYNLDDILLRSVRKKKLENIEKNKTNWSL